LDTLEKLLIERECQRLILRLTHLVDHHVPEEAADLFATNGVWIRGGKTYQGRDGIVGSFEGLDQIRVRHVVSNVSVEVSGPETADSTSYYVLFRHDPGAGATDLPMPMQLPFSMGEWHDRFVLENGRWRFAFREVKRLFQRT